MALVLKDRVKETTTTTGTGTITLAGAADGFQSFSVIGDGNTTYYVIQGGNEWEVGIGTYTSSGTTLARNTILESSNSGSAVNFSAGTKFVFVTYPAERSMYVDGSTIVPAVTATLPVVSGGTGAATLTGVVKGTGTAALTAGTVNLASEVTGTLPIANGGTGQTTAQAAINALAAATTSGQYLRGNGSNVVMSAIQVSDVPTLNQNTTGTAANVTGTVAVANGGTGATTNTAARTNLGATTLGANIFTIANPSAITFPRMNADNTVSSLSAADFRTAIGAGTGTVTSVASGTGLTGGPITSTGTLSVATNGITNTLFRQSAGLSVVGRSANTTGDVSDVTAGTDHQVLRRSGTSIGFGSVALNQGAAVTGTLPAGNGGTGASTLTANNVLLGNGTSALQVVAPGTTGNVLTSDGTTWTSAAPSGGGLTAASTAEAQAGTSNTVAITPLRLREGFNASGSAPVYAARAWVNFNGTGSPSIRASGNVSSITDRGTGLYTVNFTTALPNANYAMVGAIAQMAASAGAGFQPYNAAFSFPVTVTTSAAQILTMLNGALNDTSHAMVAFHV